MTLDRDALFIGGAWATPATDAVLEVVSPHSEQVVARVVGLPEQIEDGHQFGLVVGGVLPAARRPAVAVHEPGPARGAGVGQRRSVGGSNNHRPIVPGSALRLMPPRRM